MPTIIKNPKTFIDPALLEELETFVADEGQVIIHGFCRGLMTGTAIRIWPSTYLNDRDSSHQSELVHFEKISAFPAWTPVLPNSIFSFTLIFSGLSKICTVFSLYEDIPEKGGFYVPNISRNQQDVYYLEF